MLTKKQKEEIIKNLRGKLKENQLAVFCNFEGIPVDGQMKLKKEFKKIGGELSVIKRRLLIKALGEEKIDFPEIVGAIMIGLAKDETLPAKIISNFPKKKGQKLEFVGGVARENGKYRILEREEVKEIADLPSREELLSRLVGTLKAPIANLNFVLRGNLQKLVYILSEAKNTRF